MSALRTVVAITILLMGHSFIACAAEVNPYQNLEKFEALLLSQDVSCEQKQSLAQTVDAEVLQELFDRLGAKNVVLRKARERNDLMNIVFAYEGEHSWNRSDPRVLQLVFVIWREMMVPNCFDPRTSGMSSKEWLMGARWAIQNELGCKKELHKKRYE